jgi:hypothetical protein
MSFQQKFIATCFLTAFMFGASSLLLAATVLLNQPIDFQQANPPSVAGQRAETIEVLKEPIKLCSHDTKSGDKDCIPLEIISNKAQSETLGNNQASHSSDSASERAGVKRALYAVTWEGTTEVMIVNEADSSQVSAINNPFLEETQNYVAIELQNESSTVLDISDRPIPQEDNNQLQNDSELLTTYVEKDDVWESNNSLTELSPTPTVLTEQITTTEQLAEEQTSDEPVQVNLEATTSETNAQTDHGEGYFSESSSYYWFSSEETQE